MLMFVALLFSLFISQSLAVRCASNGTQLREGQNSITCSASQTEANYWAPTRIGIVSGAVCSVKLQFIAAVDEPGCFARLLIDGKLTYEVTKVANRNVPYVKYFTDLNSNNYFDLVLQQSSNCYSNYQIELSGPCLSPSLLTNVNIIPSGLIAENFTLSPAGGYTYFSLPLASYALGVANVTWSAVVTSYRGLKPPLFIISDGALPTLERHQFTNTTVKEGDNYIFTYTLRVDPNVAVPITYVLGMYLYGTASRFFIGPRMQYLAPNLNRDETTSVILRQGIPVNYNISIPKDYRGKTITFQFAREVPGGNTTILFGYGYMPSQSNYNQIAETAKSGSFGTISVPNTLYKIRREWEANPGYIMVSLLAVTPQAGILVQWQLDA